MAILQNMWLRGSKKKLGGTVLYVQKGRTLQRELAPEVSNPRTPQQMQQRVKWSNLVTFYRANKSWMSKAFENKKATQSDYNKFMSLNVAFSDIYLTKQEAASNACLVYRYKVSDGSLPAIEVYENGNDWVTDLYLGTDLQISESTTLGAFATAVLSNNASLQQGDQLSFIRFTQNSNNDTGVPYIQVRKYELLLVPTSTALLKDYFPIDLLAVGELQEKNALMIKNNGGDGGFSLIFSRTSGGKILVSPSYVTVVGMSSYYGNYRTPLALERAMQSYGVTDEVFLSSNSASSPTTAPTNISISNIKLKANNVTLTPGAVRDKDVYDFSKGLDITFSGDVSGDVEQIKVVAGSSTGTTDSASVSGAVVSTAHNFNITGISDDQNITITVTVNGVDYVLRCSTGAAGGME